MKKTGHPEYQDVLFVDTSTGTKVIIGSTMKCDERETHDGVEYPVCRLPISSTSHPHFTGSNKFVDSEGRVDKFRRRYGGK